MASLLDPVRKRTAEGKQPRLWEMNIALARVNYLESILRQIQQWDCLNPPDPTLCADHPWLKRLVDDALR